MSVAVPSFGGRWWEIDTLVLFGLSVPVFPTVLSLLALWVGREIAKDPRRKLTRRQNIFLNVGLTIVTFLVVTGKLWGGAALEVGGASMMGFGIGMNGILIFEIFQRATYSIFTGGGARYGAPRDVPADSVDDK